MSDKINHPSHYTKGGIECIEAIKASMTKEEYRGYLKGNIEKYIWRYEEKGNPAEDLKKARVYLNWLIGELESEKIAKYEIPEFDWMIIQDVPRKRVKK